MLISSKQGLRSLDSPRFGWKNNKKHTRKGLRVCAVPEQVHGLVEVLLALLRYQGARAGTRDAHRPRRHGAALAAPHVLQLVPHAAQRSRQSRVGSADYRVWPDGRRAKTRQAGPRAEPRSSVRTEGRG